MKVVELRAELANRKLDQKGIAIAIVIKFILFSVK